MAKATGEPVAIRTKDPDSLQVYTLNYNGAAADGGPWLGTGETIATSAWVVPKGISGATDSFTNTTTSIDVSGGTAGKDYDLINQFTTSSRAAERTLRIRVRQR